MEKRKVKVNGKCFRILSLAEPYSSPVSGTLPVQHACTQYWGGYRIPEKDEMESAGKINRPNCTNW